MEMIGKGSWVKRMSWVWNLRGSSLLKSWEKQKNFESGRFLAALRNKTRIMFVLISLDLTKEIIYLV